jgi:hypothetical protein
MRNKNRIIAVIILVLAAITGIQAQGLSYFGYSGLMYTPTGTMQEQKFLYAMSSYPVPGDEMNFIPRVHRVSGQFLNKRFEVALSSTYILTGESVEGYNTGRTTYFPVVPSLKFRVPSNLRFFDMAFGATSPYGPYYALDWTPIRNFGRLRTHTAFATKLVTYHAFLGLSYDFLLTENNPVTLTAESGWGGSLKDLGEKEEAFIAFGIIYSLCQSIDISTHARYDADHTGSPKDPLIMFGITIHKPRWKENEN